MALLGEDGRGFELARKLETLGVWRAWLGDSLYASFVHYLSSSAAWDAFMRPDESKPKFHINLQLRARALLFDKASACLFSRSNAPLAISKLNPNYLELHGDDVYFTLESSSQNGEQRQGSSSNMAATKGDSKSSGVAGSRYSESEVEAASRRFKLEEWPETWYSQFFEKNKAIKLLKWMLGDKDPGKRSPEQMSAYLRVLENHKRRRIAFLDDASSFKANNVGTGDALFFPETMFFLNCVPDSAVLRRNSLETNQKIPFNGVLDSLPPVMTKSPVISPIMIERLGIRPEYLNIEQRNQTSGGSRKVVGEQQASKMSEKAVARLLSTVGFESSSDISLGVLGQLSSSHIRKLGCNLKLLADSYRKQYSAIELIKMFLQTSGYSDVGTLSEIIKDNTKYASSQQMPQSQLMQSQQILRQMSPQVQQMNNPQFLALQQQHWERMRRRQQQQQSSSSSSIPSPGVVTMNMNAEKERQLVQVKMESASCDFSPETAFFAGMNPQRHSQLQTSRQQQFAAISSMHSQVNQNAFRAAPQHSLPQVQPSGVGASRAPPVKVEGFQELMGVDSPVKHGNDENKLLSPPK
ncbi:hypothetical protein M569_16694 [Genlisea aurea]|uniref:Bromodomain associated domain-containing protein n=1 Tax=Genlisea aurea TaxID=192259 RepID=S8DFF4_9LAMI|nr:hypothetical protein M569_16694 [Genlisea aurea]